MMALEKARSLPVPRGLCVVFIPKHVSSSLGLAAVRERYAIYPPFLNASCLHVVLAVKFRCWITNDIIFFERDLNFDFFLKL